MQIRSWKNSCTQNENRFYSISLGVASLQGGWVGLATALSPATAGHFKFLLHHFFVGLGLVIHCARQLNAGADLRWSLALSRGNGINPIRFCRKTIKRDRA